MIVRYLSFFQHSHPQSHPQHPPSVPSVIASLSLLHVKLRHGVPAIQNASLGCRIRSCELDISDVTPIVDWLYSISLSF